MLGGGPHLLAPFGLNPCPPLYAPWRGGILFLAPSSCGEVFWRQARWRCLGARASHSCGHDAHSPRRCPKTGTWKLAPSPAALERGPGGEARTGLRDQRVPGKRCRSAGHDGAVLRARPCSMMDAASVGFLSPVALLLGRFWASLEKGDSIDGSGWCVQCV